MSLAGKDLTRRRHIHPLRKRRAASASSIHAWRRKTIIFTLFTVLGVLLYYLFFSPALRITTVTVPDTTYINQQKLQQAVNFYIASLPHVPIDRTNYFLISATALENFLQSHYLIMNVTIDKQWPDNAQLFFDEELSLITLANTESSLWEILNHKGIIVKRVHPFDYDNRLPLLWKLGNDKELLDKEIDIILSLEKSFSQYGDLFTVEQYSLKNNEIVVYTDKNFTIHLPRNESPETLLPRLFAIVGELREKNILPVDYIHLQFSNQRAFYK